jgi:predicted MFS family arabinose efflux permease
VIEVREATPLDRAAVWRSTGRPTLAVIGVIVCAAIPPFLVGALAPLIGDDMPFSATQVGVSIAAYYLVSGVLSPLGGRAVDRIGVVRALRLSCAITTVGLLTIAMAGDAVHVTVALGVLGIPNSVVQPAANAVLAEVRTPRLQAFVFGTVQASIPTATLVAGLVLGIASYVGGWRWTVLAVASLTLVALWLTRGLPPTVRGSRPAPADTPAGLLTRPSTPWLLVALVAIGFFASTASTSLPSYIASTGLDSGLAPGLVAGAQVLGSIACAVTRIGAPVAVSHGTSHRRLVLIAVLLAGGALGYLLLGTGTAAGFLIGTVVAYAFGWGWNGLFNQVIVSVRPDGIAAATGMTQGGIFLGGTVGPLAFAAVVHGHGYGSAWWISSGAAIAAVGAAVVAVLLLRRDTGSTPDG